MARISDSKGRSDSNSGYARLIGNQQLGQLLSRIQAAVIRSGNELEKELQTATPEGLITSLDAILAGQGTMFASDIQVVFHPSMPGTSDNKGIKGDIAVFDHSKRTVLVIELKDGDTFDTKKASGELASMTQIADWISAQTGYLSSYFFCSFNQADKEAIVKGAKRRFSMEHAMTGRELCEILSIDYDRFRTQRESTQAENLKYFLTEILNIPEIRRMIRAMLADKS